MKKITLLFFVLLFVGYSCDQDLLQETDSTAEKHKKTKDDCECDKEIGITQLTLEYTGDKLTGTQIIVKTEKPKHFGHDHNKKKGNKDDKKFNEAAQVWSGKVGDQIIINTGFEVKIKNTTAILERLGNKTWIKVGDKKPFEIHTSCSQPIGPGTILGDFVVVSAASGDNALICEVETPPDYGDCGPCDGGGLSRLILSYSGDASSVTVRTKAKGNDGGKLIGEYDVTGGSLDIYSGNNAEKIGGSNELELTDSNGNFQRIHISCSQTIDTGTQFGLYTVIGGFGAKSGPLCADEDCLDKLQQIIPTDPVKFVVTNYAPGSEEAYFEMVLSNAGVFNGTYKAYCIEILGTAIRGFEYEAHIYSTYESIDLISDRIRQPENLAKVNYILNNFKIGDEVPLTDENCNELAETGILTSGDIQNAIWHNIDAQLGDGVNLGTWDLDRVRTIICDADNNGSRFEPECGDKIAFMIVPKDSGQIVLALTDCFDNCDPPEVEDCGPCEGGGISSLTLEYKGSASSITVASKPKGRDASAFVETYDVSTNKTFTVFSGDLSQKIGGSNEIILTDSEGSQNIHISCSQPIDIGLEFGDYKIVDGYGVKSGPFCKN